MPDEMNRNSLLIKTLLVVFCASTLVAAGGVVSEAPADEQNRLTTVILVRHAERDQSTEDGDLTVEGRKRAQVLMETLKSAKIAAIYTSQRLRTKSTAEPLAKSIGIGMTPIEMIRDETKPNNIAPQSIEETASAVRQHKGETILIVGHSNTIPEIIKRLGIADPPPIGSEDYDDLFIVTMDGTAKLIHLHFGASAK